MPLPLLAIGLGLGALGGGAGIYGINKSKHAMDAAMRKHLAIQSGYQDDADAIYRQNLAYNGPIPAQGSVDRGASRATAAYNDLSSIPFGSSSSTGLTASQAGKAQQNVQAYDQLIGAPNALTQGITNYDVERWINNLKSNTQLNAVSAQAGSAASAFNPAMQQAQQAGAGYQGLGSLLGSVGGAVGTYGAGQNSYNSGYSQGLNNNPFYAQAQLQKTHGQLPFFQRQ